MLNGVMQYLGKFHRKREINLFASFFRYPSDKA